MKTVSVVVPTYNRLDQLQKVLEGLEAQTYPRDDFEVVVVSDGSSDGTDEYLRAFQPGFSFVPVLNENQGPAAARNCGFEKANGRYILFIDDDVVPDRNLLQEHMRSHQLHQNAVVIGPMLSPDDFEMQPWVSWEQSMLVKQYEAMKKGVWQPTARQFYTGNASLLRSYLVEAGGFDPSIKRAEDVELAYRLADKGLNFVFNFAAVGFHYARRSFDSWLKIPYAYGRNDVRFALEKNQDWLLPAVYTEFQGRNFIIKGLCRLCLDRQRMADLSIALLTRFAAIGHALSIPAVPRMVYSGIFNLRYYQGVADGMGGREVFYRRLNG